MFSVAVLGRLAFVFLIGTPGKPYEVGEELGGGSPHKENVRLEQGVCDCF